MENKFGLVTRESLPTCLRERLSALWRIRTCTRSIVIPIPAAWVPMTQQSVSEDIWRNLFLIANTGTDPNNAVAAVGQEIHGVDKELAITDVSSMEQLLRDSLWQQRFSASILGAFSLAALGIAVLGVFGVTSYLVALRSHEIGVRMALGARPADILKMVLGQSFVLVAVGTAAGLLGAFALTRVLQGLLFGDKTDRCVYVWNDGGCPGDLLSGSVLRTGAARCKSGSDCGFARGVKFLGIRLSWIRIRTRKCGPSSGTLRPLFLEARHEGLSVLSNRRCSSAVFCCRTYTWFSPVRSQLGS